MASNEIQSICWLSSSIYTLLAPAPAPAPGNEPHVAIELRLSPNDLEFEARCLERTNALVATDSGIEAEVSRDVISH